MQLSAMREYAKKRNWSVEVKDVGSGATTRPDCEKLIAAARRREFDLVLVWRLDRWGRSLVDLVTTLQELAALDVGFVSLGEALDLTTPSGRALAGMLAVFAEFERDILRDRVKAGIAQARKEGRPHGRPKTAGNLVAEMKHLRKQGESKTLLAHPHRPFRCAKHWTAAGRQLSPYFPGLTRPGGFSHRSQGQG